MDTYFSPDEVRELGIGAAGDRVLISRKASIYEPERLKIGDNVRIDDFCVLSGDIELASNIHISAYCALYGKYGIRIEDYSGLSPRCTLLSGSDDFSGEYMVGPMAPSELTRVQGEKIVIHRFCQVGAGSVIMPGVILREGVAIGALSFVKGELLAWTIYGGNPLRLIKERKRGILGKYEQLLSGQADARRKTPR